MPKKKTIDNLSTQTVSTNISTLNDSHVNRIRKEFAFLDSYNIKAGIEDAVARYKLISKMPKEPTPKKSNKRFSDIQVMASALASSFGNLSQKEKIYLMRASESSQKKFSADDAVDYLNEISLQMVIAQSQQDDAGKVGRNKKTHQPVFINKLFSVYQNGTEKKVTCSYSELEGRYQSDFVRFCEYVIDIYNLDIGNSAIGELTRKIKSKTTAKKT